MDFKDVINKRRAVNFFDTEKTDQDYKILSLNMQALHISLEVGSLHLAHLFKFAGGYFSNSIFLILL